ncbi:MAG: ATP-binding protein [Nibricoccus sp.]
MIGFFELRLDYIYFLHGVALALIAGSSWGLFHLENRRGWSWLALFGASQAAFVWLNAITFDLGDNRVLYAVRVMLLAGSFFCLVQFARKKLYGMGLLRLNNWVHMGPAALLVVGIIRFGRDFADWYMPVLGLLSGLIAGLAFIARSRGTRQKVEAVRLQRCAFAFGFYALVIGCTGLTNFASAQDPGRQTWLSLATALVGIVLAIFACWTLGCHYSLQHHLRLGDHTRRTWAHKRQVQSGILLLIVAAGWFSSDHAMRLKDESMRNDILLRTRLLAASIPPEYVATFQWNHTDLNNPRYQEIKQRMMAQAKANPDIRFLMLTGLRKGEAYFLVDSEAPDSPDYSPPGQHYDDAEENYLHEAAKHQAFVLGPLTDHWGTWISASVPLGAIGPDNAWVTADADISAAHWSAALKAGRLPALLITLIITLLLITYFYAQDRIHESLARLTVSEQRTSTLVEGSPNCVQMFDPQGRCTAINQNGLNALDRRRDEIIGQHYLSIWPVHTRELVAKSFDSTLKGQSTAFESEYHRPDGQTIIWRVALTPTLDDQRNLRSLVSIGVDISDLKQTEKELLTAKDAAEAANRTKSEFLAVMSHEIRTPLSGVIGMLNVLRKYPMEPDQQLYTDLAKENAENLLGMLDDILDTAKVEAGKLSLETIAFDPVLEFGRVLEPMRVRAEAKGLTFTWTLAPDLPPALHGDPTRLRQVLANLLSNALKFTENGSIKTEISIAPAAEGRAELRIEVIDTGIGIEKEKLACLFSRFEQGDISTTRRFGGTGLGLSIVKNLAELMRGDVQVKSTPGISTIFTFTASVGVGTNEDLAAVRGTIAPISSLPRHRARLHILCAEDDLTNQVAVEFLVIQMGHSIEFVDDGQKAVDWLACNRADVVLMDNRMPVMDGFQATQCIRNPASTVLDHQVYIIANTANAASGYRERCLAAGMNDYLIKPLREDELHAALERTIVHLEKQGVALQPPEKPIHSRHVYASSAETQSPMSEVGLSEDELLAILDEAEAQPPSPPQLPSDAIERITELYFAEAPQRLAQMRDSLASANSVVLARAAHSLKGTSSYIQAAALSSICAEIERFADNNQLDRINALVVRAEKEFEILRQQRKPTAS